MKKSLLILLVAVLAILLVACGGEKTPEVTEPSETTTTTSAITTTVVTTTIRTKFTVRFIEPEEFDSKVLSEMEINRGKSAKAPVNPKHEGYIFLGWDIDDFSSITSDLDIYAMYRPLDTYNVTFYGEGGVVLGETVTVTEGGSVEAPEAPKVYGKFFVGWDKKLEVVDRKWSDFEQYSDLSVEEVKETKLEYKVTAIYEDTEIFIPYKENISMDFKETRDQNGVKIYEPVDAIFKESKAVYYSDDVYAYPMGHTGMIYVKGKFTVAWDGEWVYVYADVYDPTLVTRGEAYCLSSANPWHNDAVEVHYTFDVEPTKLTRNVVKIDAYGYKKFANPEQDYSSSPEHSNFFEEIEVSFKQAKDANRYYAIFKIPAKTEEGKAIVAGDPAYFSMQINDLQSLDNIKEDGSIPSDLFCIGGWRYYYHLSTGAVTKWNRMIFAKEE